MTTIIAEVRLYAEIEVDDADLAAAQELYDAVLADIASLAGVMRDRWEERVIRRTTIPTDLKGRVSVAVLSRQGNEGDRVSSWNRGASPWGCHRCGCAPTRHNTKKGGCQNQGCACPRAVYGCPDCGGWRSAYSVDVCSDCYSTRAEVRKHQWIMRTQERQRRAERIEQKRHLRRGAQTLRAIKSHLGALPSQHKESTPGSSSRT